LIQLRTQTAFLTEHQVMHEGPGLRDRHERIQGESRSAAQALQVSGNRGTEQDEIVTDDRIAHYPREATAQPQREVARHARLEHQTDIRVIRADVWVEGTGLVKLADVHPFLRADVSAWERAAEAH
jgi:hypothetical protein